MKYLSALVVIAFLVPSAAMAESCAEDKQKFCKDLLGKGNKEEVTKCLEQHMGELSDTCKTKMERKAKGAGAAQGQSDSQPTQEQETKP